MWRSRNSGSKRERLDLFLGERDLAFADRLLQPEQSLVAGLEAVADPHPRTSPELTWSPLSISSVATRWAPWVGCLRAWARIALAILGAT